MKKLFIFCLVLLLLASTVNAAATDYHHGEVTYSSSDWASEGIYRAFDLGITFNGEDYREPIKRGDFAERSAYLVALKFGTTLDKYFNIVYYRAQISSDKLGCPTSLEVAKSLGIIQGREDGSLDTDSFITRQEAATMLARTYRAYGGDIPDKLKPLNFADRGDIASWAIADVQLMNQLGIMTGVEDDRFDPLGSYTMEQCCVTLVRLYDQTPAGNPKKANPFSMTPRENVIADILVSGHNFLYQFETKDYFILIWEGGGGTMAGSCCYIAIIDQDLSHRDYRLAVVTRSNSHYGDNTPTPENVSVSEDGTKLFYTATVNHDVYYNGLEDQDPPIQIKGIYTVTMDLKTGEQTYTRADLN